MMCPTCLNLRGVIIRTPNGKQIRRCPTCNPANQNIPHPDSDERWNIQRRLLDLASALDEMGVDEHEIERQLYEAVQQYPDYSLVD